MNAPACDDVPGGNASIHRERFHALDATRAFALLLGIVFHAAWSFVPVPTGAPIVDANPHPAFDWFFFTSHAFRMQLFFLIAGFFAHLMYHRRGLAAFTRNRLTRIAVPFVVGWLVLYPLVIAAWMTGRNLSGHNLEPLPLWLLFLLLYAKGLMWVPQHLGGMFSLAHLWFLYYLLWLYALVLVLRLLLTRSSWGRSLGRDQADRWLARTARSPWSVLWLTLGMGLFLWPMKGWFGVDTPVKSLVPSVPVLVFYGAFFVLGWLLHRQAGLLTELTRRWRWHLALGLALSIPLFMAYRSARERSLTGSLLAQYPRLEAGQITDWPALLRRLQSARDPAAVPPELANLWGQLRPAVQQRVLTLTDRATPDERAGVAEALDRLLPQPGMFRPDPIPFGVLPPLADARRAMVANRTELERLFAGALAGDPRKLGGYRLAKLAYSIGYGLVMWLLLFGTLGFFQALCVGHSPAWRYVADSSYWIYLVHVPLVAGLQIWMAPWPWPGWIKFLLLNAIVFVVLFASYHYLVRSTVIGRVLNGRSHPFVAWPFRRSAAADSTAGASPELAAGAVGIHENRGT